MTREAFNDLVRDVPDRVRLSPAAAWADARRRRLRRRALTAGLSATAVLGLAVGLANLTGADRAEPAPSPDATFVRAVSEGDTWRVTRSDGTTFTLDPKTDFPGATLGLSPDGRWLSYAQGPGRILTLFLQRSDQTQPRSVSQVEGAIGRFAHQWSPDSKLVLVPVADGDVNVFDTDTMLGSDQASPGTAAGFVDNDSLGWITAQESTDEDGLTWEVTDLKMTPERSLQLQVDRGILNPPHTPQLMLEQASLSPDGSRVAALLANPVGPARVLVFSTADGAFIERRDTTKSELQLDCPFRWHSGLALLPRPGQDCVVEPN